MSNIPDSVPTGAIRFNTDSNKMECFNGTKWMQIAVSSPDLDGGTRALAGGGLNPSINAEIMYWNIASAGNAADFGDLTEARGFTSGASSRTRAVFAGGGTPTIVDTIDYVTFASTGDAVAFGELGGTDRWHGAGASNQTRGLFAGGETPTRLDEIDYITIASTGDAKDFGDLTTTIYSMLGACASHIRGMWTGGYTGSVWTNSIQFITIATTGNAAEWGDLITTNSTPDNERGGYMGATSDSHGGLSE